jgi:hypothetical protein
VDKKSLSDFILTSHEVLEVVFLELLAREDGNYHSTLRNVPAECRSFFSTLTSISTVIDELQRICVITWALKTIERGKCVAIRFLLIFVSHKHRCSFIAI